jgi:hypothetical protein
MAAPSINYERAAIILAEADLFGDRQIAARWGIGDRTVRNYRTRAVSDSKLSSLYQLKKQLITRDWQTDATRALKVGLDKITHLIRDDGEPAQIHAVAGAIKIIGELKIASEALSDTGSYLES